MSLELDKKLSETGTRFLLRPLPAYVDPAAKPEIVTVSVPPDKMSPGPADDRMYVVDAIGKLPYEENEGPPYAGARNEPIKPNRDGHFDHLVPGTREFRVATMYATVRRVLDIMEDYFRHTIPWEFEARLARMELIPLIDWDNAQSGPGYLEFGYGRKPGGVDYARPYCENFDVLSHELGHAIIFSQVGVPTTAAAETPDYSGFHESSGDLTAIICAMHFNTLVDRLLANTYGDLFTVNELDRVGELSADSQIRIAFNYARMSEVGNEPHDRSLPLTGAIFDILVEVYQKRLVAKGLISQDLAKRSMMDFQHQDVLAKLQKEFKAAHAGHEDGFKAALLEARDYLGSLLAQTWGSLEPDHLSYRDVVRGLLAADRMVDDGKNQDTIRACFAWRQIPLDSRPSPMRSRKLDGCGLAEARPPVIQRRRGH